MQRQLLPSLPPPAGVRRGVVAVAVVVAQVGVMKVVAEVLAVAVVVVMVAMFRETKSGTKTKADRIRGGGRPQTMRPALSSPYRDCL